MTVEKNINNNSSVKWRNRKIESIVEIEEGFLIGIIENSPNAEIVGFSNPQEIQNKSISEFLGKELSYNSVAQRTYFLEKHKKIFDNTFIVIGQKKPNKEGKPSPGILIGGGNNVSGAYLRIVGFINPSFAEAYYNKLKELYLNSPKNREDDENESKSFWPNEYWKKFALKDNPFERSSWTGTMLNNDDVSMKLLNEKGAVKEIFIQRRFRQ